MTTYLLPYSAGTVTVTNGSTAVTGYLTAWLANVKTGDRLIIGTTEGIVASVESNTALTLALAWSGSGATGASYRIDRWSRGWYAGGDLALNLALYISNRPSFIPTNGAPSNSIGADGNIAVDAAARVFYTKSGGVWGSAVSMVGPSGPAATSAPIVILASGQSNMALDTSYSWTPASNLTQWNWNGTQSGVGTAFVAPSGTTINPALAIGQRIALANPHRQVRIVRIARSGRHIAGWLPNAASNPSSGDGFDVWAAIAGNMPSAMTAAGVSEVDLVMWWQGESDVSLSLQSQYPANFEQAEARFRGESWCGDGTPFMLFGITESYAGSLKNSFRSFNYILEGLVMASPGRRMFVRSGAIDAADWPDGLHMGGAGHEKLGYQAYNAWRGISSAAGIRTKLTGNGTFYVRTDGNDGNDGAANTAARAFATLQGAYNWILRNIDAAGYAITIVVADGTYSQSFSMLSRVVGAASIFILGNTSSPSSVALDFTAGYGAFTIANNVECVISGVTISNSGSVGQGVLVTGGGRLTISTGVVFGSCTNRSHIEALSNAIISANANYTITGGAQNHLLIGSGASLTYSNRTITITGSPNFSGAFINLLQTGLCVLFNTTWAGVPGRGVGGGAAAFVGGSP